MTQLQKAEDYLRTTNAAVCLETCLLNLMLLLRSDASNDASEKQSADENGHHHKAVAERSSIATD
ncbi:MULTISPECIES: hypothetical protein [Trichocoleus]|uniref:Uncharacterized protein n=1 Tax=Trichocoleus desertorum GB2-A4 TaxID=2933944 RepID=A0ABV0JGS0_9CYAN|nr:hypothetical protein [Trichocoleus sp. FACHB-46]